MHFDVWLRQKSSLPNELLWYYEIALLQLVDWLITCNLFGFLATSLDFEIFYSIRMRPTESIWMRPNGLECDEKVKNHSKRHLLDEEPFRSGTLQKRRTPSEAGLYRNAEPLQKRGFTETELCRRSIQFKRFWMYTSLCVLFRRRTFHRRNFTEEAIDPRKMAIGEKGKCEPSPCWMYISPARITITYQSIFAVSQGIPKFLTRAFVLAILINSGMSAIH